MLSREEILTEYARGLNDPCYVIETYLKTFDQTQKGFVKFMLFKKQREVIESYIAHRYNLVTKPRQAGISTVTAAFEACKASYADSNNPEQILILANKRRMAQEFLSKIKGFIDQMPRWVWGSEYYGSPANEKKSIYITESMEELKLPNGSRIRAVSTSKDALRGFTPTKLIMDEAAFIDNGKEVYGAAMSSMATGGAASLISTPNGRDELYYKTYHESQKGDNDYNIINMKWYQDPRYNKDLRWIKGEIEEVEVEFTHESFEKRVDDEWKPTSTWYENMCRNLNNDSRMIAQELDVNFLGSGNNVIEPEYITYQEKYNMMKPLWKDGLGGETWIWARPVEGHEYAMGVDVSRGDGEDTSTIEIVDITTMEQVLEFQGKVPPDVLGEMCDKYGREYGDAYAVVDTTGGLGVTTVLKMEELKYPNLHYQKQTNKILTNAKERRRMRVTNDDKIAGLVISTGKIRTAVIGAFEKYVRLNEIKIRSSRTIAEMHTFIFRGGRPDHQRGYHDDCIFGIGMVVWVVEFSFKELKKMKSQAKAMLSGWKVGGGGDVTPDKELGTGFVPKNQRGKKALKKPKFDPVVSKNMQDPNGDYLWLLSGLN